MRFEIKALTDIEAMMRQDEAKIKSNVRIANRRMLEDIHHTANPVTPMDTSQLRRNVFKRILSNGDGEIEWKEEYSGYQEAGRRADGTHIVKHYTTPGTGAHYAEKSVDKILDAVEKYYLDI